MTPEEKLIDTRNLILVCGISSVVIMVVLLVQLFVFNKTYGEWQEIVIGFCVVVLVVIQFVYGRIYDKLRKELNK